MPQPHALPPSLAEQVFALMLADASAAGREAVAWLVGPDFRDLILAELYLMDRLMWDTIVNQGWGGFHLRCYPVLCMSMDGIALATAPLPNS